MNPSFRHLLMRAAAIAVAVLICAPLPAQAGDYEEYRGDFEQLQHQRASLVEQLQQLEDEHQNSVETIESLKDDLDDGQASRSELQDELRANHEIVESLEHLQRQLRQLDAEQTQIRAEILDDIDERRDQLEQELRDSSADRRSELVGELNELQQTRRQFSAPLPEADQRRLDEALADARAVSEDHPRAMLAAADELEDTQEQLTARLEGLEERIDDLERARAMIRQSRQFGEFNRFFDEGQRSRTIVDRQQAVESEDDSSDQAIDDLDSLPELHEDAVDNPFGRPHDDGTAEEGSGSMEPDGNDGLDEGSDPPPGDAPESDPGSPDGDFADGGDTAGDPFDDGEDTETVVIESDTDPEYGDDSSYFSDDAIQRDLQRLRQERDSLEQQAEQLRRIADQLREDAEQAH